MAKRFTFLIVLFCSGLSLAASARVVSKGARRPASACGVGECSCPSLEMLVDKCKTTGSASNSKDLREVFSAISAEVRDSESGLTKESVKNCASLKMVEACQVRLKKLLSQRHQGSPYKTSALKGLSDFSMDLMLESAPTYSRSPASSK